MTSPNLLGVSVPNTYHLVKCRRRSQNWTHPQQ